MTEPSTLNAPGVAPPPRPPGALRRLLARRPGLVDGTIAGGYLFGCALMLVADAAPPVVTESGSTAALLGFAAPEYLAFPWVLLFILKVAVVFLSLLWRRKYPVSGLIAITVVATVADPMTGQAFADGTALVFALYAVPVYGSVVKGWIGLAIVTVGTAINSWIFDTQGFIGSFVPAFLFGLVVLLVGINLGNRRRYVAALVDRADRLERERDQLARIAVAEERERIAREMHDIVAHSVSVMVALSEGAARAAAGSPEAAARAMEQSAETGRSALTEMRRLLGALSADEPEVGYHPQPQIADLPELVQEFRVAGIDVSLTTTGSPPADHSFELAVYRIVQESLTNTLRHAGMGARAEVTLQHEASVTQISIRDYGPGGAHQTPSLTHAGSGRGLRGLEERVRVFGGTLTAGPVPRGGWQVRAVLPRPHEETRPERESRPKEKRTHRD